MPPILFYCISTELGGAERSLLELIHGSLAIGHPVRVIVPKSSGPLIDELNKTSASLSVIAFPKKLLRTSRGKPILSGILILSSIPELIRYIAALGQLFQETPAVIHCTGLKCHWIACWAARGRACRVLWHLRDIPGIFSKLILRLHWIVFKPKVIANSKATAAAMPFLNAQVLYNGFDPELFFPERNPTLKQQLNLKMDTKLVGLVGVIARWKGQLEFIQMAHSYYSKYTDQPLVHFVIVGSPIYDTAGDSGYSEQVDQKIKDLGLTALVHRMSFQKDPARVMNGLDLLVHCSTRPEPFGRVLVEAMLCNTPVIASPLGGTQEIIDQGESGFLIDVREPERLADQVHELLTDHSLRQRIMDAALPTATARFSIHFTRSQFSAIVRSAFSN